MGDGIDRLLDEILGDARDDDERLRSFAQAFEASVRFPFPAHVVGAPVQVTDVAYEGHERLGLVAVCRREAEEHAVSLLDVVPGLVAVRTSMLMEAYRRWCGRAAGDTRDLGAAAAAAEPPARGGRLLPPDDAPPTGERLERLLAAGNVVVEQILSGADDRPHAYLQSDDEWVALLAGAAVLDVDGERLDLGPGDWAFLPGGVPHTVLSTAAGTSWLAVHIHPAAGGLISR
jgi:cupin 2 domain-containing protein